MSPDEIVEEGLTRSIFIMKSMIVNEGQRSILVGKIIPNFEKNSKDPVENGWSFVSAGPYVDFLGETVEAGNQIMNAAFKLANQVKNLYFIYRR